MKAQQWSMNLQGSNIIAFYRHEGNESVWEFGDIHGFPYHTSFEALQEAAQSCEMCKAVHASMCKMNKLCEESQLQEIKDLVGLPCGPLYIYRRPRLEYSALQNFSHDNGFSVLSAATQHRNTAIMLTSFGFSVTQDSPLAGRYLGRRVPADPMHGEVYHGLRSWLHRCIHEHGHRKSEDMALPSRLLDVSYEPNSTHSQVRLIENTESDVIYTALSHCWGSTQRLKATSATLDSMKRGISFESLPKTFIDAVIVTRHLGVKYLWIDSLCIQQDNTHDWQSEASKMAAIYENAVVTIAADRAHGDDEGFLGLRPQREYFRVSETMDDTVCSVLAFPIPTEVEAKGGFDTGLTDEPVSDRAWTLQERLLSTRTIHFGKSQIVTECRSHFVTEDGYCHPIPTDYLAQDSAWAIPDYEARAFREARQWRDVVGWYTRRQMTFPSDKLPALAGLAHKVNTIRNAGLEGDLDYLAGLWRSNLLEGLCWFAPRPCQPSKEYRAPSWSWASVDGPLLHGALGNHEDLAVVEDAYVRVPGRNRYGAVTAGWVQLRACCLQVEPVAQEVLGLNTEMVNVTFNGVCYSTTKVFWDHDSASFTTEEQDLTQFWVVPIAYSKPQAQHNTTERQCTGLLLQSLPGCERNEFSEEVFRRKGVVKFEGQCVQDIVDMEEAGNVRKIILI
ncbi:HET-domain-containing protein [Sporormia fimetaria CBS 119925]|uniref:HET-domain-containing protein n=1 Tax=Sporormia fimetaria CBS 119925 TaxID=1340428 RepID=A0A6A6UYJ0_9PLEO|nr:HET-domain-containing protein [Sporormia fimetaria CBS 119925]